MRIQTHHSLTYLIKVTCHQPCIHTVSKLRRMYGIYMQSMHSTRCKYTLTHTCRIWKQHTHSHTYMINNSIRQTRSEPDGFSLWAVCKRISRQRDLFLLCLLWLYNKLRNNSVYVLILYLLVEGFWELWTWWHAETLLCVGSTWLWLQRLQSSWEPALINGQIHSLPSQNGPSPVSRLQPDCRQRPRDWAFVIINIIHHHHHHRHHQTCFPAVYWGTQPKEEARGALM